MYIIRIKHININAVIINTLACQYIYAEAIMVGVKIIEIIV